MELGEDLQSGVLVLQGAATAGTLPPLLLLLVLILALSGRPGEGMESGLLSLAMTCISPSPPALPTPGAPQLPQVEAVKMTSLFSGFLLSLRSLELGVPGFSLLERRLLDPPESLSASAWLRPRLQKAGIKS